MSLGSANSGWIKTLAPGLASPSPGAISLSASYGRLVGRFRKLLLGT